MVIAARTMAVFVAVVMAGGLALPAFAGEQRQQGMAEGALRCDESMKTAFKPDANTTVLDVRKIRKGDPFPNLPMENRSFPDRSASFAADLCWVKLLVGPGIPGPADAASTSKGIGIEVFLPEKSAWNGRFHGLGGAGWANGTEETILGKISSVSGYDGSPAWYAGVEGEVTATTDNGQQVMGPNFALLPDGTHNVAGWRDWAYRGLYEQAVKAKALIVAYYGKPARYSYFSGGSGGGRQALHVAQNLPEQYDGILPSVPGPTFGSFIPAIYPALMVMRELDGKDMSREQLVAVTRASVAACDVVGGKHLGFILDVRQCRYDPTRDAAILCRADGGTNATPACLTARQAAIMNRVWYGLTVDGSVPDPAVDNGWDKPLGGKHVWHGYPRGGAILSLTDAMTWLGGPGVGRDVLAIMMRDPSLGTPGFKNAIGTGQDGWKNLSYAQLAGAYKVALALNDELGFEANNPDLTRLRNSGTKLLHMTNMHDASVWVQGHTDYYDAVVARMGGLTAVQSYYKFYIMPGLFHGNFNGSAERNSNPPVEGLHQGYKALIDWVEKGISPDAMIFESPKSEAEVPAFGKFLGSFSGPRMSLPACAYPRVATYLGGDITKAASYRCN